MLTAANVHDSNVFEELVDTIELIKRPKGRPRKRPAKLHADKGYDAKKCRQALRRRGIKSRIARKGKESSERLGRHRWVVERTLAWLARYRRLAVRYERRADSSITAHNSSVIIFLVISPSYQKKWFWARLETGSHCGR